MTATLALQQEERAQAQQMRESTDRFPALDGVRGIAILLVLFCHCASWNGLIARHASILPGPLDNAVEFVAEWSNSGVDLFFVLSGFLITNILIKSKNDAHYFRNFYGRRVLRIFPLYYLYLFLIFYMVPLICKDPILSTLKQDEAYYWLYLGNFAMLLHAVPVNMFLTHTWSLCIEEQFYMVWPFLVRRLKLEHLIAALCVLFVSANLLRVWLVMVHDPYCSVFTPCRLDTFAAGALIAVAWTKNRVMPKRLAWALIFCAPVACALFTKLHAYDLSATIGLLAVCLACSALLSLSLDFSSSFSTWVANPLLKSFGKYSYSIYLFHLPIVYITHRLLITKLAWHAHSRVEIWLPTFLVVTAASLLVAMITYTCVEQHFLRLKVLFAYR